MTANLLIDDALQEIAMKYKPGLLAWIKRQPDRWDLLLQMEATINQTTLAGDETGLKTTLSYYRSFFEEMTERYLKGQMMPLFKDRG